jgi:hypothetical protein
MKILIFNIAISVVCIAWFFRWDITPISNGDRWGGAYMLNRLTGDVYVLHGTNKLDLSTGK